MDAVVDILMDACNDTLALVPFLFVTYIALEALEHTAGSRVNGLIKRAGAAGPAVGAVLGVVPQCGFSAMAATLYAGRIVTLGTLVAVFLSTSDEMLPMLVAEHMPVASMARILLFKGVVAAITGFIIDTLIRVLRKNARVHAALRRTVLGAAANPAHVNCAHGDHSEGDIVDEIAEAGAGAEHIHELCVRDHCGCDDDEDEAHGAHRHRHAAGEGHGCCGHAEADHGHGHDHEGHGREHACACDHGHGHGHSHEHACACGHDHGRNHSHEHAHGHGTLWHILHSAVSHTVQVSVFIFLVTLVLVAVLETVGEPELEQFLRGNETLAVFASALVGLIPNCSASVVITQLYLEGALPLAPMLAGTLISAGVGYLVLFRTNRSARENIVFLVMMYVTGVLWGLVFMAFGL